MRRKVVGTLLAGLALAGLACSTVVGLLQPTATPPPTVVVGAAATTDPTPTEGAAPGPTATPSCEANEVLARLRPVPAYAEFAISYQLFQSITRQAFLTVWFVDPDLDPQAPADQIEANIDLAIQHATVLLHQLRVSEPCLGTLADIANPVVVDANYNGWFSGQIQMSALPLDAELTDAQVAEIGRHFVPSYRRRQPAAPQAAAPAGSCSWPEALEKIRGHFDSARNNVGAQFVIDESGVNVYAQWEATGDQAEMLAPLPDVSGEIRCLHPAASQLTAIVVDEGGAVELVGTLSADAIASGDVSQVRIVFKP